MTSNKSGDHLARRSDVTQAKKAQMPKLNEVLMVEDERFDAKRLAALLNLVLGRETKITIAPSLDKAIDAVLHNPPDMVFLDDYLEPNDSALETIPMVRRAGYKGPIVVISGEWDRERAIALRNAGANGSMHKEDLNSVDLTDMLVKVFAA